MTRKRIKPGFIVSVTGMIIIGKHTRTALEINHIINAKVLKTYRNTAPKVAYTIVFGTKIKLTGEGLLKAQSSEMKIIWE